MLRGSWWGVNNPIADDMSCFPNIKAMFCSINKEDVKWINELWDVINFDKNEYLLFYVEQYARKKRGND